MLVPAVSIAVRAGQFDKPHPPLDEPPRKQALTSEGARVLVFGLEPGELFHRLGFAGQIGQLGH